MSESLIEYPCAFPIKIMGKGEGFANSVLTVVLEHDPEFEASSMEIRASREGKYLSLTCTVNATSRSQLDALYKALCDHPQVVMVL
jgi:putative lipoic acid-binding regulatory protein